MRRFTNSTYRDTRARDTHDLNARRNETEEDERRNQE